MNAPVSTTYISDRTVVSDELIVNREGSTALQKTSDLAMQIAGEGAVAAALQTVRADVSESIADMTSKLEAAAEGVKLAATWAKLATIAGDGHGQIGRVPTTDTGTHVDPVNGAMVRNSGDFAWSVSPAGWERIRDTFDVPEVTAKLDLIGPRRLMTAIWAVVSKLGQSPLFMEGPETDFRLRNPYLDKTLSTLGRNRVAVHTYAIVDRLGRALFAIEGPETDFRIRNKWLDKKLSQAAAINRSVVIDGDSRVDQCMDGATTNVVGWLYWLTMLSSDRIDFSSATDEGTGGQTTTQILAGIAPVLASSASIVIALMSTNDRTQGMTAAASIGNMADYQAQVLAAGKRLIWVAETPRGDLQDDALVLTGAQLGYHLRVREWLLAQASVPGVAVADPWMHMVDPADTQARARQGVLKDGIHESPTGAYLIARAIAAILEQWLAPRQSLPTSVADLFSADNPAGSLVSNGMMAGTGGTAGANTTGDVATGWTVSATTGITAVCSKVTDADGHVWQEIVVSGTAAQRQCVAMTIPVTLPDAGDILSAVARIEVEDGHSGLNGLPLTLNVTGTTTTEATAGYSGPVGTQINMHMPALPITGPVKTAPITAPASPASASLTLGIFGDAVNPVNATVRLRAVAARKII
ncbi:SGNH/GDSL hydrolase family protein [Agrobacterium pusense]|uniref:SGNH/GDSL hydrolase family protein n=1 Tax=Agrobacterium pusense TaxID=648995 RepID=A0AA44EJF2_9HYPH|nr:SGNH/GDSL hydrolase family protein [Agrobacterium pusense]NRF09385.1 SGNH/GDSL hydrolase family protein [Agrobacterium pusense]NRF19710.1 SGNH/GDSL hydrolase family protein [Agrobacterium pusense]